MQDLAAAGRDVWASLTGKTAQRLAQKADEVVNFEGDASAAALADVWIHRKSPEMAHAKPVIERVQRAAALRVRLRGPNAAEEDVQLLKALAYRGGDADSKAALEEAGFLANTGSGKKKIAAGVAVAGGALAVGGGIELAQKANGNGTEVASGTNSTIVVTDADTQAATQLDSAKVTVDPPVDDSTAARQVEDTQEGDLSVEDSTSDDSASLPSTETIPIAILAPPLDSSVIQDAENSTTLESAAPGEAVSPIILIPETVSVSETTPTSTLLPSSISPSPTVTPSAIPEVSAQVDLVAETIAETQPASTTASAVTPTTTTEATLTPDLTTTLAAEATVEPEAVEAEVVAEIAVTSTMDSLSSPVPTPTPAITVTADPQATTSAEVQAADVNPEAASTVDLTSTLAVAIPTTSTPSPTISSLPDPTVTPEAEAAAINAVTTIPATSTADSTLEAMSTSHSTSAALPQITVTPTLEVASEATITLTSDVAVPTNSITVEVGGSEPVIVQRRGAQDEF